MILFFVSTFIIPSIGGKQKTYADVIMSSSYNVTSSMACLRDGETSITGKLIKDSTKLCFDRMRYAYVMVKLVDWDAAL
jgi:hypothetical protein